MAAPAFPPFQWATASPPASTVIPAQLRPDGYRPYDPLTSAQFNRAYYEIGEWLYYLNAEVAAPFVIEHYPTAATDAYGTATAAGTHRDITADSVVIRGEGSGAGQGGRLEFRDAGRASDNTATIGVGAVLAETVTLQVDAIGGAVNVELELVGGVWRSTLAASAAWAMEVDSGSNQTLYVRNVGVGLANLDVDGVVNVQGTLGCGGLLTANDGINLYAYPVDNAFARYAAAQTFRQVIAPYAGGWTVADTDSITTGTYQRAALTTPPAWEVLSGTVCAVRALDIPHNGTTAPGSAALRKLTGVQLRYYRGAAGDLLTFEIVRVSLDGADPEAVVLSYDEATEFTTTGAWTSYDTGAIAGVSFDPELYYYFARITANRAGSSLRIAEVTLSWEARHIEAAAL